MTNAFFLAWRIFLATESNDLPRVQEGVVGLLPIDLIHVREVALFNCRCVSDTQHYQIEKLIGYTASGYVSQKWKDLLIATHPCFEEKGMSVHQPDYAPLGMGLLFDDWQESYVDMMAEDYQLLLIYDVFCTLLKLRKPYVSTLYSCKYGQMCKLPDFATSIFAQLNMSISQLLDMLNRLEPTITVSIS